MLTETETNKELLLRLFEAINAGDFAALEGHPGFHETRQYVPPMHALFADWRTTHLRQIVEGDTVVSYGVVEFTQVGPFAGIAPTGKRVQIEVLSFDKVQDGIVVEHNSTSTWPDVLRQLGSPAFAGWPARSPQPLPQYAATQPATTLSENKAALAKLLDAYSRGNTSVGREHAGLDTLANGFVDLRVAFPDLSLHPVLQVAEGDLVAMRARLSGTHAGALYGVPASGSKLSWDFFIMARVANGVVIEERSSPDWNDVLAQLGLLAF
jgi:predicted ester cyclase